MSKREYVIVGAGLAGSLLGLFLARRGHSVRLFERRSDPRLAGYVGGRSINLALAERGLHGLRLAGLESMVIQQAVMMRGRMVHEIGEAPRLMRYGRDDREVIWSVNRGRLNLAVLEAAEAAGARVFFDAPLGQVDFDARRAWLGTDAPIEFDSLIGCDGAGSALRAAMLQVQDLGERFEPLGHGYKELEIPAAPEGAFRIEANALHIWPRGGYMLIALPNIDGSFTVTLFLANEGEPSFASVGNDESAIRALFETQFASAVAVMPEYRTDFQQHPTGFLATLRLRQWQLDRRAVLLGDAAHAVVPFHGQGMNCAFEDCVALDRLLAEYSDLDDAFSAFVAERQPNANAIADMAIENYVEMRDSVADDRFVAIKQVERMLADRFPTHFVPRYAQVMFHRVPYAEAQQRGAIQTRLLEQVLPPSWRSEDVDLQRAEQLIRAELTPFPYSA